MCAVRLRERRRVYGVRTNVDNYFRPRLAPPPLPPPPPPLPPEAPPLDPPLAPPRAPLLPPSLFPPVPPLGPPFPLSTSNLLSTNPPLVIFPTAPPIPLSLLSPPPSFLFSFKLVASLPLFAPARTPELSSLPLARLRFTAAWPRRRVRGALDGRGVRPLRGFVLWVGREERRAGSWEWVGRREGVVRGRRRVEREASREARWLFSEWGGQG